MTALLTAWRAVTSRPVLAVVAAVAVFLLLGEYKGGREANKAATRPVVAQDTPATAKMERAPLSPSCPEVTKLVPTAKERKLIEREFGVALAPAGDGKEVVSGAVDDSIPARAVLGVKDIPSLPDGGTGLISLPPGGGEVELTIRPKPRPFFSFDPVYRVGVLAGLRDGLAAQKAFVGADFLRIGRIHLVSEAGFDRYGEESGWFAGVGAEIRF